MIFVYLLLLFIPKSFTRNVIIFKGTIYLERQRPNFARLKISSVEMDRLFFNGYCSNQLFYGGLGEKNIFIIVSEEIKLIYNKYDYNIVYNGYATGAIKWNNPIMKNCVFQEFNPNPYKIHAPVPKASQQDNTPRKPQGNINFSGPKKHSKTSKNHKSYNRN
ncbi:hypothetical protein BB558_003001 [Smittium angustum]|uniref:Uncharacterized protein n=1 Tax=Smittium angustum TaxID=133377 RepID=A0A2U1J770_SMIAN|nr:hypothetical protein BB558_003001 [Smittium angustum]